MVTGSNHVAGHMHAADEELRTDKRVIEIPKNISDALAGDQDVTPCLFLLGIFYLWLYRYTPDEDFSVTSVIGVDRELQHKGFDTLIGQSISFSTTISACISFRELIRELRTVISKAAVENNCDLTAFHTNSVSALKIRLLPPLNTAPDICLELLQQVNAIGMSVTYRAAIFEAATINRMLGHWQTLLERAVSDPDLPVSKLPLLTATERRQLLVEWNNTTCQRLEDHCVHELIEQQAAISERAALIYRDQHLSYRDLNARANQLAHYLKKRGAEARMLIGICLEPSFELVIALLAILKLGATYVPLDPEYPTDRLAFMAQDSDLQLILTKDVFRSKLSQLRKNLISVDSSEGGIASESTDSHPNIVRGEDIAYLIYTSGSTGNPKGVRIRHGSLVNFLISMQREPGLTAKDVLLAVTTICFDIAALELFLPLVVGAQAILVDRQIASDGQRLRSILEHSGATVMQATPATWRLLLASGWQGHSGLKILCGGEAMSRELANELLKRAGSVWNMYGPTETTVWSTISRVKPGDEPITIGRPIAHTKVYVLDKQLEPVPIGVKGDLYIGGEGVAQGYFNRPDLNAEKFLPDPFSENSPEARMYKTGDIARFTATGELEWLGRADHQVKVRGFRIELGEIESILNSHRDVQQSVVIDKQDPSQETCLIAYVVRRSAALMSAEELRSFLRQKLPEYMLPSELVFLDKMPLTPNGKVDRSALRKTSPTMDRQVIAPRDSLECSLTQIWEAVLEKSPIGIHDNFFELGGHSLLVARLVASIEQSFGKRLSMADVFRAPTVAAQIKMLRQSNYVSSSSAVVPVQPFGSKPPLIFLSFDAGPVFLPLARRLGPDQPILALGLTSSEITDLPVPYRMEDIAAQLVNRICEIKPRGPYYLSGVCAGGLMAYEVARQLAAEGKRVALVALFETSIPTYYDGFSRATLLRKRAQFHLSNLQGLQLNRIPGYIQKRASTAIQKIWRVSWNYVYRVRSRVHKTEVHQVADVLYLASSVYRPGPYSGRIAFFQAKNRPPDAAWDLQSTWRDFIEGRFDMCEVPGDHDTILLEPNVEVVAGKLAACMSSAAEFDHEQAPAIGHY